MTLDEIRAQIVERLELAKHRSLSAFQDGLVAEAALQAHDRAVAAMQLPPQSEPAQRRNIADLVLEFLDGIGSGTVDGIAKAIDARPSQVAAALDRLGDKVVDRSGRWEVPPLHLPEKDQAA